jgi:competence protein ComEC
VHNENPPLPPAVAPLIGLIAGLATGPFLVNPRTFAFGLGLALVLYLTWCWLPAGRSAGGSPVVSLPSRPAGGRRYGRPAASTTLLVILGILLSLRLLARDAHERRAFEAFDSEVFATIEAPIERDWSLLEGASAAPRSFVLRASHFRANGVAFDAPVSIYTRDEPPAIGMEASIRAEGFLRTSERGDYVVSVKSARLMAYTGRLRWWQPSAWNRALANRLERQAGAHPDEIALAQALVLGRGERLSDEMRDSFRRGGTYHLLVFSGLQIAFAAGILAALLRWLHRPRASDWLLLVFALLAPPFIGGTASVVRSGSGIGLYALSRIFKRPTSVENLWCVAALLRLLIEPRDLHEASFHLTYAGAAALLFVGKHFRGKRTAWLGQVVAAEVVITPLTLFHFHQYALGGSLLTVLISPLIFAMLIVSTLAIAVPWEPLFEIIGALHRLCTFGNGYGFSGVFASPPTAAMITAGALALLALATLRGKRRALAIAAAMLIPTLAAIVHHLQTRSVADPRVTFLDVGQGDAIVIRSRQQTMLVDGGRDSRILALLADRGVQRIDTVLLTHAHPDHCGGLGEVIESFDVGVVWLSPQRFRGECAAIVLEACSATGTPIHLVHDGDRLSLGEVTIEALLAERTFRRSAENNASIVLRVRAAGRSFLLTGDIEKEAELSLADRNLRADVLKVPHHGSRSSSSDSLLANVAPRLAVISCGRRNLFGHPHAAVLSSLRERRIRVWRTDRDGSIDVEVRGGRVYAEARID